MQRSLEQYYAIKFCAKPCKSGSETLQLLRTAYGDVVLSSAQVFSWHKLFKDGRESVKDEQRAGRPSTSGTENNVADVKAVLGRDRCLNVVNRRGGRTTENGHPPNHYRRSAREKFVQNWSQRICMMCGNFWIKIISQCFPTHRTALTWLCAISFYSPSSKPTSRTSFWDS
jgi:hypothetical protein